MMLGMQNNTEVEKRAGSAFQFVYCPIGKKMISRFSRLCASFHCRQFTSGGLNNVCTSLPSVSSSVFIGSFFFCNRLFYRAGTADFFSSLVLAVRDRMGQ